MQSRIHEFLLRILPSLPPSPPSFSARVPALLYLCALRPRSCLFFSSVCCPSASLTIRSASPSGAQGLRGSGTKEIAETTHSVLPANLNRLFLLRNREDEYLLVRTSNRRQIGCSVSSRISPTIRCFYTIPDTPERLQRSRSRNRVTTRRFFPADSSAISVPVKRFSEAFLLSRLSNESERNSARPRPFLATPREPGSAER